MFDALETRRESIIYWRKIGGGWKLFGSYKGVTTDESACAKWIRGWILDGIGRWR